MKFYTKEELMMPMRKQVIATSELKDALTAISNHLPIEVRETTPVGCYISMRKAN